MNPEIQRRFVCALTAIALSVPGIACGQSRSTAIGSNSGVPAADSGQAASAASGSVSGTVKDATGAVIANAQIMLEPGATTAVSNAQGGFFVQNVPSGKYTVTISEVGFKNATSSIEVAAGQNTLVNATMTVASSSQQVVVRANLEGDVAAINEQRTSANILNVMTAEQIQSLPNASIATVVGRMPGVTVQINEGEAQYVQIRGTEPRLSNTTLDGVIVPGPDPQVRQVDLWVIPADLVGAVQINKTLSANEDGDAIGGSVNMQMRQATSNRPTLDLESLGGWNPIDTGQPWFRDDATVGKRFGVNQRLGLMFSYSYDLNNLGTDDVEPTPDLTSTGATSFDNISIRQYLYNHTRYGFGGSADYKLNEGSDFFAHGLFSNFKDYGAAFHYDINSNVSTQGNPGASGGISFSNSLRRPNYQISLLTLGGNQVFKRSWVKYVISVGHSREGGAAGNPGADFAPTNSAVGADCAYDPSVTVSIHRPQFRCGSDPIYSPAQYSLQDVNLTSGDAAQLNLTAAGSYGLNYHAGSHASTLEFGAQVRNEHKGQYAFSPTYDNFAGTPPLMSMFTSNFKDPSYYGGSYKMGPLADFGPVATWLAANPTALPLDVGATHLNSDPANYHLQERVTAGYIMNTVDLGSRASLQTGLRIEATNESNTGYLVVNDMNGNYLSTSPVHATGSYVSPLPSAQFRYRLDQSSDIRAVFGRGISRPDPYDLVPFKTLDESTTPNTENIGNPALVAEHANDYDVLYERFLPSVGMIEAGYFYKQLGKPLFQTETTVPNPFPNPITPTVLLNQWENGGHAYVQGIEFAYQQHLDFLPGVLAGARIDANVTWTNSRNYDLQGRTDTPALVGQAPLSYNITPSYATRRAEVEVGISYDGPNIATYQWQTGNVGTVTGPYGDNYYYERTQVDAQATYYVGRGLSLTASEENANNAVLGFYNGSPQYMTQREYYKPIYYGGLRWSPHREQH
ncbi:MAG TPA: TonB-dependent receptor [Acidobacteriaceae bacterium]|jgi:TonB-dependent receptor|nr:TonB-dependent receptor [Acidobacteriaceae bacterium]